jgi:hypothetical protein
LITTGIHEAWAVTKDALSYEWGRRVAINVARAWWGRNDDVGTNLSSFKVLLQAIYQGSLSFHLVTI